MTRILLILMLVLPMFLMSSGCESKWGTAGLGAAGGGYEYNAKREMDRIEADYKAGRIDQREYEIRKDQIQRMSVLK